eukprot:SAG11_NODE_9825_length_878_cov_1.105263_2_plen_123_part_01
MALPLGHVLENVATVFEKLYSTKPPPGLLNGVPTCAPLPLESLAKAILTTAAIKCASNGRVAEASSKTSLGIHVVKGQALVGVDVAMGLVLQVRPVKKNAPPTPKIDRDITVSKFISALSNQY